MWQCVIINNNLCFKMIHQQQQQKSEESYKNIYKKSPRVAAVTTITSIQHQRLELDDPFELFHLIGNKYFK
jgi:hypothetical protein